MAVARSVAIALSLLPGCLAGPTLSPDDPAIRYIGRFDTTKPKLPQSSWPMAGITVAFHGSQTVTGSFQTTRDGLRMRVVVDGQTQGILVQKKQTKMQQFTLAKGLDASKNHTLQVFQLSEGAVVTFGGFELDAGQFDSAPKAPARRLEFIGDSDTAGWCADGSKNTGDNQLKYEDPYVTWAQQLARSVGAEGMVEAVSGYGVERKTGAIGGVLDLVTFDKNSPNWDYTKWTPDAVVILIGPNDESLTKLVGASAQKPQGQSTNSIFITAYKALLNQVAKNYKDAKPAPKIIHVCGGSLNGFDPCNDIQTANKQFNAEGGAIQGYFTSITKDHWNLINGPRGKGESPYNGCDGHYNEKGHAVVAKDILPQLEKIMGWQAPADEVIV